MESVLIKLVQRMSFMNRISIAISAVVLVAIVSLVAIKWGQPEDRFVRLGVPKPSPSGAFVAHAEAGPLQNGVATRVVVVKNAGGSEVFRDSYAYSTRHGVGITWVAGHDQLWVMSGDVGVSRIELGANGSWQKTSITPETASTIPKDIRDLLMSDR